MHNIFLCPHFFEMMSVGIHKVRFRRLYTENTVGWSDFLLFVIFENGHIATDIFMS